jgi:cellulose synthase operon protein YhjQ
LPRAIGSRFKTNRLSPGRAVPLISVVSPKGGVGKTTVVANVAAALAGRGRCVVALDLDPQDALGLHFGLSPADNRGFMIGLQQGANPASWRHALLQTQSGVFLLPFGRTSMEDVVALQAALAMDRAMLDAPLRNMLADPGLVVIADLSPGPSAALSIAMPLSVLMVTVLIADAVSVAAIPAIDGGQTYGQLTAEWFARDRMGFVLNQWDNRTRLGRASGEAAARHFGERLLGIVYRDENVVEAVASQLLVTEYAPASKAAQDIAALAEAIDRCLGQAEPREQAALREVGT